MRLKGKTALISGGGRNLGKAIGLTFAREGADLVLLARTEAEVEATGLASTDDRESAIVTDLDPASYTAIVRGASNTTGVALVEAYDVS